MPISWKEEADVIVVGYGGAGACTAVSAHDSGAKVLILEKQAADTPTRTNHTPSSRMSGGNWFAPQDPDRTALYLRELARVSNEALDEERKELIAGFARMLCDNNEWLGKIGVVVGGAESVGHGSRYGMLTMEEKAKIAAGKMAFGDYSILQGSDQGFMGRPQVQGKFRDGAALFMYLSQAVQKRNIPIMWETPAVKLVYEGGEVRGVIARRQGKDIAIKANRGVVLTCGGFEFNTWMKEHYLKVNPTHFYGTTAATGDGLLMTMEIGALMWHMNCTSFRCVMKFPELPVGMGTRNHETGIFVDKFGRRFSNERYRMHAFGYELTNYDSQLLTYPRVPLYLVFDENRKREGCLSSFHGVCNPPGGIPGDIHYTWSDDNEKEIAKGWLTRAGTIEGLAEKLRNDPESSGFMSGDTLCETIKRYNELCRKGEDTDFKKEKKWLRALDNPPYYAIKLWPGGPNTQGGPMRDLEGRVLNLERKPIPRLYSAGELGSYWSMLYEAGGNLAECFAFGRVSGANAAGEKAWK